MSDTSIPSPGDQQPTPPPPPHYPGAAQQPTQAYPGAVPSSVPAPPPALGAAPSPYAPGQNPSYPAYGAPGYGAPAYSAPAYAAPRPASGLAVTSLVCGIAGVVFGSFLFWLVLPFFASIVAIITGHLALRRTKTDPGIGGRGMAFAGLIMGYAMVAIQLVVLAILLFTFVFVGAFSLPFLFAS